MAPLIGRDAELERVLGVTRSLENGSTSLLVEGEPGIGKSALLTEVLDTAQREGRMVLAATGVQSEASLPFAALHQLLRPIQQDIERLPAPQRASLSASFGLSGADTDLFLNALGTLSLLAEAGGECGVVVVVEDVHWLDSATRMVIEFVIRRLNAEPVAVILSARSDELSPTDFSGVARMTLGPLAPQDAASVIALRQVTLPADLIRAVQEQARGNPLALIELATTAAAADTVDAESAGEIPLTERLEQAFADRYRSLPESTKAALLVAALNESDSLAEAVAAGSAVVGAALDESDIELAVGAGLVTTGRGRVAFRHPLVRSAVRQSSPDRQVRNAHRALASVSERTPDRRLWHLAAAATRPDDGLADALATTADRVAQQGDLRTASLACRRAADLSSTRLAKASRLLTSAEFAARAGRTDSANALLAQVDAFDAGALINARSSLLREFLPHGALRVGRDIRPVMQALENLLQAGLREPAADALCRVASLAWSTGMGAAADRAVLDMARRLQLPETDPRMLHVIAFADPIASGAAVRRACHDLDSSAARSPELSALIGCALGPVGALDDAVPFLNSAVDGLRRKGALRTLVETNLFRAWNQIHRGRFRAAASSADESARLAVDIGEPLLALPARLAIAAADAPRGVIPNVQQLLPDTREADELWLRPFVAMTQLAACSAHLARGEYNDAYAHGRRLVDETDPAYHSEFLIIGFVDYIEAATHSGRIAESREVLTRLDERFAGTSHDVIASGLALGRALVATVNHAEHCFERALAPGAIRVPLVRARTLLAYGAWLRRQRHIAEGREYLHAAQDEFDQLEIPTWADKARAELRAAGVVASPSRPVTAANLTPQEHRIAALAAQGLTNKQIGERLFLSHRTVSTHLYATFPKLGISSRDQISAVLTPHTDEETGA